MTKRLLTDFAAEQSPGLLLWRLHTKWQTAQRTALERIGLTHVQFVLLVSLVYMSQRERPTQKQLAEFAQTDIMMTSQVVRRLEQKSLVTRARSDRDSRKMLLEPTLEGIDLANRAVERVESVDKAFFMVENFDLPTFVKLLRRATDQGARDD